MSRPFRPFDPFERGGPLQGGGEIRIPRPPRRFWFGAALFGLAFLVFILASPIVWFFTELQWYDSLGFHDVFTTRLWLQTALFAGSLGLAFIYLAINVLIALRIRSGPGLRAVGISRSSVRSPIGIIALLGAALVALVLSGGAGTQWQTLALFQHASPTGITDPVLGQDVSFYLLTLPFLHSIANWLLGLDFMTALLVGALYAWRGDTFDLNLSPRAVAHLSVLLGVFAVTLAAWTWLGRYDLMYAHNSTVVWGAAYTDVNARLPLYSFQAGAGIVLAGALIVNAWLKRLWLPVAAAGIWVAMLLIGQIYPGIVQSFFVTPSAQSYELPYIVREIAGTRAAYGLSNVTVSNFTGDQPLTLQEVQSDQVTVNNLRLWDYAPLKDTYEQLQTIRTYYTFNDIDIDRYTIGGQYQQLEISAREFDFSKLPSSAQQWVNQHLVYTHGYGLAASPVNAVVGEGLPDYVVGDVPPTGTLKITQPAIYFGEVTNDTLILYRRNILQRASELAPFLTSDGDPYTVVVDGRVYWILDAYTTGSTYPYSQTVTFQPSGANPADINYVRNSVKVVIDADQGTADSYVIDPKAPIIKAYQATFPSLFKPIDAMPAGLRAHLRVPIDLFDTQVQVHPTYHITDPKVFFAREDVWDIPTAQTSPGSALTPVQPYYVLFRLPGEQNPEFLLIMPFTPRGKQNMVSWMAARNDGAHYGEYVSYILPKDKVIFGPQQVASRINQDPAISRDFTLFHQAGSSVVQGNLLVVPIGNSFLYFEPIYLQATSANGLPELKKVILADSVNVAYADTLQQAIDQLVGTSTAPPPTTPTPTIFTPAQVAQVANLVTQANLHYAAAYAALKAGDLTTFASEMATVGQLLQQLQQLTGTTPTCLL